MGQVGPVADPAGSETLTLQLLQRLEAVPSPRVVGVLEGDGGVGQRELIALWREARVDDLA